MKKIMVKLYSRERRNMDNKRNRLKRGLVLVLTLVLVGNGLSHTMLSALAKENEPEVTDVQEDLNEPVTDQPDRKSVV